MLYLEVVLGYRHFDDRLVRAGRGVDSTKVGARSRWLQDPILKIQHFALAAGNVVANVGKTFTEWSHFLRPMLRRRI